MCPPRQGHAWRADLERGRAYLIGQAKTAAEQEFIDQAYEPALAEGRDFTNYRTGSDLRQAPKLGIDRNTYAQRRARRA